MNEMLSIIAWYEKLNLVAHERIDPLFLSLFAFFQVPISKEFYIILQGVVFIAGLIWLSKETERKLISAIPVSILAFLALLQIVGPDPFFLKAHWFPALVASFISFEKRLDIAGVIVALGVTILWCLSSGVLSVLGLILAIQFVVVFSKREQSSVFFFISVIIFLVTAYLLTPIIALPGFPHWARLVPIGPEAWYFAPKIGPHLSPDPLNYHAVVSASKSVLKNAIWYSVAVLVLSYMWNGAKKTLILALMVGVSALVIGGESFVPSSMYGYLPSSILFRLVPFLGLERVSWLLAPLCITAISLALQPKTQGAPKKIAVTGFLVCLLYFVCSKGLDTKPLYGASDHFAAPAECAEEVIECSVPYFATAHVRKTHGDWVLLAGDEKGREKNDFLKVFPQASLAGTVRFSDSSLDQSFAIDGNLRTAWKSADVQKEGTSLTLSLSAPVNVAKISLHIRPHSPEFPRAFKVEASLDGVDFKTISSMSPWHGPVEWTKEGVPFYGLQSSVDIHLEKEIPLSVLRITLLANDEVHYWTINEIELFTLNQEQQSFNQ